jgi:hypothetical protein
MVSTRSSLESETVSAMRSKDSDSQAIAEKPSNTIDSNSASQAERGLDKNGASSGSEDETLPWPKLVVIGIALWFAVFLYSLVNYSSRLMVSLKLIRV